MNPARTCERCGSWPCRCGPAGDAQRPLSHLHPISEPCVCGGPDIRAETSIESDISAAVDRHQVEPRHIAWRVNQGIPAGPTDRDPSFDRDLARELVGGRA